MAFPQMQSLAASLPQLPTTTPNVTAATNTNSSSSSDSTEVSRILYSFFDHLGAPPTSSQPTWASSSNNAMDWPGPSNSYFNNNDLIRSRDDPSNISSMCVSICSRCEDRLPTHRCFECNSLYCHDCCHNMASECRINNHTLTPLKQMSPIGVRPNSVEAISCEDHNEQVKFYCQRCTMFICTQCTNAKHKEHFYSPIKGAIENCRLGIIRVMDDTKVASKAVKSAIDQAIALSKAYEREVNDATSRIRRAMGLFTRIIEEREKSLLEKLERMRLLKVSQFDDSLSSLRNILHGLASTNEHLATLNKDAMDVQLFSAKEKSRSAVDYYMTMFKNIHISEEKVAFMGPSYEFLDLLKKQCDVQTIPVSNSSTYNTLSVLQGRQSLMGYQSRSAQSYSSSLPYNLLINTPRSYADYSSHSRAIGFFDHNISSNISIDSSPRGIGQAVPGHCSTVSLKPCRSSLPGVPMFSFGKEGSEEGQVSRPWGLCINKDGHIIIADRRNNRVQIFDSRGEFKNMFGTKGTGPGEFDLPAGITTDMFGRIVVIDKDNHRVQIFTSTGNFILTFGSFGKECGQFQYPWDVAVNSVGNIIVTDTRNHRIQLFTSEGGFLTKFVFENIHPNRMMKGPTTPRGVCFTNTGNIVVSDFENHRLMMVDSTLSKVINCVGREGSSMNELNRPSGIVTDDDGHIIVADSKNHRVLVFTSELIILWVVDLKSPGLDDKDRPSDVALTPEGHLVVLFETLPDTGRELGIHAKQYIKVY